MKLGNEEIIQSLKRVREWFQTNVKSPCYACTECEFALVRFMALTYDNMAKKLPVKEIKRGVQFIFETMLRSQILAPR